MKPTFILLASAIVLFSNSGSAALVAGAGVLGTVYNYYDFFNDRIIINEIDSASNTAPNRDPVFALAQSENRFAGARASAGYGWLRASSHGEAQSGTDSRAEYRTGARSEWADVFTLTPANPLLIGTPGTMRVSVTTSGIFDVNIGLFGYAAASAFVNLRSGGLLESRTQGLSYIDIDQGPVFYGDSSLNIITDIAFVWGVPFDVAVDLTAPTETASAEFMPGSVGIATSDFGNTSEWQGILGVFDSNNNPVSDYAFASQSGTDYRQAIIAIPEPSSPILLSLGVVFGLIAHRRRERGVV